MSNFVRNYYPQRPVKSFQDLEVYQKLLAVSVAVAKRINSVVIARNEMTKQSQLNEIAAVATLPRNDIAKKLVEIALDLPIKIATAHSLRFGDHAKAVLTLEEVMLDCNLLIVYLEQYRDIENTGTGSKDQDNAGTGTVKSKVPAENCIIENEFFEEQIRTLLTTRFKVLHLQQSWKKFDKEKELT